MTDQIRELLLEAIAAALDARYGELTTDRDVKSDNHAIAETALNAIADSVAGK